MRSFGLRLFIVALAAVASAPALAQSGNSEAKLVSKADKSGTNPINFTNDLRAYYEYQDLSGGGEGHVGTLEGRTPVFDGKVQIRVRVPFKALDFDVGGTNISESGLGDINARLLTVPYLDPKNGLALAVGLEMFFPTAGEDVLGDGLLWLGPQIFGVKFAPFGINQQTAAPPQIELPDLSALEACSASEASLCANAGADANGAPNSAPVNAIANAVLVIARPLRVE